MITRSTLLHLRFPFSLLLLPVFLFAVSQAPALRPLPVFLAFVILHLLVYPASNGFNSYYDRDEESIGMLETPPAVSRDLLFVSLGLDGLALLLAWVVDWRFAAMIFLYGLVSKLYSHPAVRLKQYPWLGWCTAVFFQGFYTYLISTYAIAGMSVTGLFAWRHLLPAVCSSLMLGGFYPLTQVYQHEEDARRGDRTASLQLGVKGTFRFVFGMFLLADAILCLFFWLYGTLTHFLLLQIFLLPAFLYFSRWSWRVSANPAAADFVSAMRMNLVGALPLNLYFLLLTLQIL